MNCVEDKKYSTIKSHRHRIKIHQNWTVYVQKDKKPVRDCTSLKVKKVWPKAGKVARLAWVTLLART